MAEIAYGNGQDLKPQELSEFYGRIQHGPAARPEQIRQMMANSAVFVTARAGGRLIGVARGLCDGLRGYLSECKLDPEYQGPAAVTKKDGRIEHDCFGVANEMARQVVSALQSQGAQRIDVVAWNTEVDFLQELGFKRRGGLVGMSMLASSVPAEVASVASATVARALM